MTKRKNCFVKVLCYMLAILIVLNSSTAASLAASSTDSSSEQTDWFDTSAFYCLRAGELDMEKDYYVSQAFSILRETDGDDTMCFVFCDEKCVGEFWVNEDMQSCTFFQSRCEDMTNILENNIHIALVSPDKDHIYVIQPDTNNAICIYGICEEKELLSVSTDQFMELSLRSLTTPDDYDKSGNRSVVDESCYLNIPIHGNALSPDTGEGLCWIASALSIVDYKNGATGYNTLSFYNYLKSLYNPYTHGYPCGTETWITRAFTHLYYTLTDYGASGLTFNTVKNLIDNDIPIFTGMHNANGTQGHAIVLCGYSMFSDSGLTYHYTYRIWDTNYYPGFAIVSASETGTNFTYSSYTQWTSHYY